MLNSVTWKIGGEAGFGIISAGTMLSRIAARLGYFTLATNEYPSLIRGGHNLITVRISIDKIESMLRSINILVALNRQTVEIHKKEITHGDYIVFDSGDYEWTSAELPEGIVLVDVPLTKIMTKYGGEPVMRNTIALGASLALLGIDFTSMEKMLSDQFGKKGQNIVDQNVLVAKAGYDHIIGNYAKLKDNNLVKPNPQNKLLTLNGSEAVGIGAVRAGLKFAAIYPMTPINALITFLADHAKKFGLIYKQPEDEIAGINMALGASNAGVRSMVATSGGGFALMTEGLSLAGIMELPVVIDMGMRAGPATGMPTWTEQGELLFVIHAGHGEFARIVLAPSDAEEAYKLTVDAFNLADEYQVPVFVLTDKYLNESIWCVQHDVLAAQIDVNRGKMVDQKQLDEMKDYKRYNLNTEDGVSHRGYPGLKDGFFIANSYEHNEIGYATDDPKERILMSSKRLKKLESLSKITKGPVVIGPRDADVTFVTWGTGKGPVAEALKLLSEKKIIANLVQYSWLYPFPEAESKNILSKAKRLILVEHNSTGQLGSLIRQYTGININERILKFDGRQIYPEEILERMNI